MIFQEDYVISEKLCETQFSVIYKSISKKDNTEVTIKIEKIANISNYLLNETKMRKMLEKIDGILPIIDFGIYKSRRFIAYPFIRNNLLKQKLNITDLFTCASQLLKTLEKIHEFGILHCDISASNVLFNQEQKKFYISDFGHSRHYNYILKESTSSYMCGSPLFCSENVHVGKEYSFRDDMISLGYLLYYCTLGSLPWSGLTSNKDIFQQKEKFRKKYWSLNLPNELKIFLNYCFHLDINAKPEYCLLKKLFTNNEKQIEIQT